MNKKILAVLLTVIIMLSAAIPVSAFKTDFFGDVDQNGEISSIDALIVLMHSVELKQITDIKIQRIADVNGDEKIDSSDALLILQKSVVLIDQLPMDKQASELINRILDDYNIEIGTTDFLLSEQNLINEIKTEMDLLAKYPVPNPRNINSFSWYDGGIVRDALYDRIVLNSDQAGVELNEINLCKIELLTEAVISVTAIMGEQYPDYDFSIAFENIDRLSLKCEDMSTSDLPLGFYSNKYRNIFLNDIIVDDEYLAKSVPAHEISHLFQDSVFESEEYGLNDDFSTWQRPLTYDFLLERFADSFARKTMGLGISDDYQSEEEKLTKLCLSTGKDIEYFESAVFNHCYADFTDCFEIDDNYFGYLTMYELSIACGYSNTIYVENLRNECYDSAMLKLFKNACFRYIKSYYLGEITSDEFYSGVNLMKDKILGNCDWDYCYNTDSRHQLEESADEIIALCNNYIPS